MRKNILTGILLLAAGLMLGGCYCGTYGFSYSSGYPFYGDYHHGYHDHGYHGHGHHYHGGHHHGGHCY